MNPIREEHTVSANSESLPVDFRLCLCTFTTSFCLLIHYILDVGLIELIKLFQEFLSQICCCCNPKP